MSRTDFDVVTGPSMAQRRSELSQQTVPVPTNSTEPAAPSPKREGTPGQKDAASR
jgi:hypothetical protein